MKKFWYKFLIITLGIGMMVPTWLTFGSQKAKAASAGSGGATTGGIAVGGTAPVPLNSFMITSNVAGDITAVDDVVISIADNTDANLEFDTTANSVEASVVPSGSSLTASSPITPLTDKITVDVTSDSDAGESLLVSKIKIETSATTPSGFIGIVRLMAVTAGGTVYGDPINVDTQKPTITQVETQDLNLNGNLDTVKVTFSENIKDSTIAIVDFDLAGYTLKPFDSSTNGDIADNDYIYLTFTEIGGDTYNSPVLTYTPGGLTDIAGNLLDLTVMTSINKTPPAAPANLIATAGNGQVSLSWDAAIGAEYYNIYYQKSSASSYLGPIATTNLSTTITRLENGVLYRVIVRAVRTVNANPIESENAWLEVTPVAPKVVLASAPVVTVAEVVQPETPEVITPKVTPPTVTEPIEQGKIKGEEAAPVEEEKINWTPWIILFILIILAGAATGGYFYWFGREEEEEIVTKEVIEKKSPAKKNSNKAGSKRSKRW